MKFPLITASQYCLTKSLFELEKQELLQFEDHNQKSEEEQKWMSITLRNTQSRYS